jgi:hypothetical protein
MPLTRVLVDDQRNLPHIRLSRGANNRLNILLRNGVNMFFPNAWDHALLFSL